MPKMSKVIKAATKTAKRASDKTKKNKAVARKLAKKTSPGSVTDAEMKMAKGMRKAKRAAPKGKARAPIMKLARKSAPGVVTKKDTKKATKKSAKKPAKKSY